MPISYIDSPTIIVKKKRTCTRTLTFDTYSPDKWFKLLFSFLGVKEPCVFCLNMDEALSSTKSPRKSSRLMSIHLKGGETTRALTGQDIPHMRCPRWINKMMTWSTFFVATTCTSIGYSTWFNSVWFSSCSWSTLGCKNFSKTSTLPTLSTVPWWSKTPPLLICMVKDNHPPGMPVSTEGLLRDLLKMISPNHIPLKEFDHF